MFEMDDELLQILYGNVMMVPMYLCILIPFMCLFYVHMSSLRENIKILETKCKHLETRILENGQLVSNKNEELHYLVDTKYKNLKMRILENEELRSKENHEFQTDLYNKIKELEDVLIENDDSNKRLINTHALTMDLLLSTVNDELRIGLRDVESSQKNLEKKVFDIPKYVGNCGSVNCVRTPIYTTSTCFSDIFTSKFFVYHGGGNWGEDTVFILDRLVKSNIKIFDFDNLPDATSKLCIKHNGTVTDIRILMNAVKYEMNGNNLADFQNQIKKFEQVRYVCQQNGIEITLPAIVEQAMYKYRN
jgi:hypothetical protein